jgi:hypothetical protein
MAKQKPKGWNAMSKAKQDAWKKANFDSSTKVTTAQLDKLRAAKTPDAAIAKYKNDPAMREALNRFYGKAKVTAAGGSSSSTTKEPPRGGPGPKMPKPPMGGPGSKTGRDGRASSSKKTITMGSRTGGQITVNKAANDRRKAEFEKRTATAVAIGASLIPAGRAAKIVSKTATKVAPKVLPKAKSMASKVKSMGTKASENTSKGKHSKTKSSKSSSSSSKSGPPTPNLTGYPKLDEAKLRKILGK